MTPNATHGIIGIKNLRGCAMSDLKSMLKEMDVQELLDFMLKLEDAWVNVPPRAPRNSRSRSSSLGYEVVALDDKQMGKL